MNWVGKCRATKVHYRVAAYADRRVMSQIFRETDYDVDCWEQGRRVRAMAEAIVTNGKRPLIVDAGANIGAGVAYFGCSYPQVLVAAIEPDPGNCRLLRANSEHVGAKVFEAAIGSTGGTMQLQDPGRGEWGFTTTRGDVDGPGIRVPVVTVSDLLAQFGKPQFVPLICKVDIEGGEADLFASNLDWMDQFPMIIIELHDWMLPFQRTSENFLRAVAERDFDFLHRGENAFCFNRTLLTAG